MKKLSSSEQGALAGFVASTSETKRLEFFSHDLVPSNLTKVAGTDGL